MLLPEKSDRDLRAKLDDAFGRNREEAGRVLCLPRQRDKQPVLPRGHVRIWGGLDRPAAGKERCRHDVEFHAGLAQRGQHRWNHAGAARRVRSRP
jgi:hypothetical protein